MSRFRLSLLAGCLIALPETESAWREQCWVKIKAYLAEAE